MLGVKYFSSIGINPDVFFLCSADTCGRQQENTCKLSLASGSQNRPKPTAATTVGIVCISATPMRWPMTLGMNCTPLRWLIVNTPRLGTAGSTRKTPHLMK
jgi:hypothetical protein